MILRDALEGRLDDPLYAVVFVTNAIETAAELIRGIVVKQIPVDTSMEDVEPRGAFFGDLNKAVQEYENLPDHLINRELAPVQGLSRFLWTMPQKFTIVSTNTNMWIKPLIADLKEKYHLFDGKDTDIVDLGQFSDVTRVNQIRCVDKLSSALPPSHRCGKKGSLGAISADFGVYRSQYRETKYPFVRAKMISDTVVKTLAKELKEEESK